MKPGLALRSPTIKLPSTFQSGLRIHQWLASTMLVLLAGCSVGPDYTPPEVSVPLSWELAPKNPDQPIVNFQEWWSAFNDPILSGLIQRSTAGNLSLQEAASRVEQARGQYRTAVGELFPEVQAIGEMSQQELGDNGLSQGFADKFTDYQAGLGLSWEIDVLGRVRRSVEFAGATVEASIEDRRDVLVSLIASVSQSYISVRTLQNRIQVAQENLSAQQETLELTTARRDSGLASDLDVAQAESAVAATRTTIPTLEFSLAQSMHQLAILLGEPPTALYSELQKVEPIPVAPKGIALVVPSELLRQRPDIRRAERALAAQTALIGVAEAELYPIFSLSGSFVFDSLNSNTVFDSSSFGYAVGPQFRWRILNFGRVRGQIQAQEAVTEQAISRYRQSILTALGDVETSLSGFTHSRERVAALREAVRASQRSLDLSTELYKAGLIEFQNVLDAQRSLLEFQDSYTETEGNVATSFVALYRSFGGGWQWYESQKPAITADPSSTVP